MQNYKYLGAKQKKHAKSEEKHGTYAFYAGVDYNLILCPLQSRLHYVYHGHLFFIGQTYARVDLSPQDKHCGTLKYICTLCHLVTQSL
jgi:hypothetical protein